MQRWPLLALASCVFAPVSAHHSLEDLYDLRRTVTLSGVVTGVEWANPHTRLFMEVKGATGETTTWSVELDPPGAMTDAGVGSDVLKAGDEISVDLWLAKDGSPSASVQALRTSSGAVFVASTMRWTSAER